MTARNPSAGFGPCPNTECGKELVFRTAANGDLIHRCDWCHHSGRADKGGKRYTSIMATLTPEEGAQLPTPKPVPAAPPPPAPPKPARAVFDLNSLVSK